MTVGQLTIDHGNARCGVSSGWRKARRPDQGGEFDRWRARRRTPVLVFVSASAAARTGLWGSRLRRRPNVADVLSPTFGAKKNKRAKKKRRTRPGACAEGDPHGTLRGMGYVLRDEAVFVRSALPRFLAGFRFIGTRWQIAFRPPPRPRSVGRVHDPPLGSCSRITMASLRAKLIAELESIIRDSQNVYRAWRDDPAPRAGSPTGVESHGTRWILMFHSAASSFAAAAAGFYRGRSKVQRFVE